MTEISDREIDFTAYELNQSTRVMYDIMEQSYNKGKNAGHMGWIKLQNDIQAAGGGGVAMGGMFGRGAKFGAAFGGKASAFRNAGSMKKKRSKVSRKASFSEECEIAAPAPASAPSSESLESAYKGKTMADLKKRAEAQKKKYGW